LKNPSKNVSIFIGIPSGTDWKADFGMCLAGMVAAAPRPLLGGGHIERLRLWNTKGSILSRSRHTLVAKALEEECTHVLFVDTDQTFPIHTLHQLLRWDKDVVAANIVTKSIPAIATARKFSKDNPAGVPISSVGRQGLEKVWRIGTGVMLIKTKVFKKLPQPWFPITWNDANQDYTGEDWNFCKACEDAKIDLFIDHELSQQIGHIGAFEYNFTHLEE
jgi:hypothetical protein